MEEGRRWQTKGDLEEIDEDRESCLHLIYELSFLLLSRSTLYHVWLPLSHTFKLLLLFSNFPHTITPVYPFLSLSLCPSTPSLPLSMAPQQDTSMVWVTVPTPSVLSEWVQARERDPSMELALVREAVLERARRVILAEGM